MKRTLGFASALLLSTMVLAGGCRKQPTPVPWHQPVPVGAVAPGQFHTIPFGYNPSVSGWPGAVGDIVQNAGSTSAWVRNGTADTAWIVFPQPSIDGGSGGGIAPDGGVTAPLVGAGTVASPLAISPSAWGASPWAVAAQAKMKARIPQLNEFDYVKLGNASNASTAGSASIATNTEGGSIGVASDTIWQKYTPTLFNAPKTGKWAITWRGSFPAPATGKTCYVGLGNAANSHLIAIETSFPTSTSQFVLQIIGVGGTVTALSAAGVDTSVHDFMLTFDSTTLTMYIDGVSQATITDLSKFSDEAMGFQTFSYASLTPGSVLQKVAYGYVTTPFSQVCTWPDGTTSPGTCMFDDEFNGVALDTSMWRPADDWFGPVNLMPSELGCITSSSANVSEGGGFLSLTMTNHSRSSCPQTWTPTAYYNTNYSSQYPVGAPTLYDGALVDQRNFLFTYGHVSLRAMMPGGNGPVGDVTLWGQNCQPGGTVFNYVTGLFAHNGTCQFPTTPGSQEFDVVNFAAANGILNVTSYVDNSFGSPPGPVAGPYYGVNYYGARWATPTTAGFTAFLNGVTGGITSPATTFHVYDMDWRPGEVTFYIDGIVVAQNFGAWVPRDPMYAMLWNVDATGTAVDGATLPQTEMFDYFRISCPSGVPCVINHVASVFDDSRDQFVA